MKPYFADLRAVLESTACAAGSGDLLAAPGCANHGYGKLLNILGYFFGSGDDARWLGPVLAALFIITSCWIIRPKSAEATIWAFLVVASPGVMLGLERMNLDLALWLMLALAGWLLHFHRFATSAGAALLIAIAGAVKVYPLAALAEIILSSKTKRMFWVLLICCMLLATAWILIYASDFGHLSAIRPELRMVIGGPMFFKLLNIENYSLITLIVGSLMILLVAFTRKHEKIGSELADSREATYLGLALPVILLFFLATTNYDYRGIFFILTLPFTLRLLDYGTTKNIHRFLLRAYHGALVYVLWAELALELAVRAKQVPMLSNDPADAGIGDLREVVFMLQLSEHLVAWLVVASLALIWVQMLSERSSYFKSNIFMRTRKRSFM